MMKDMSKNSVNQIGGQIGIIVILITAAVLTFGLSVANRVVQENKVVVDRSDSIRTFNTAETGIDEALNQIYLYETGDIATLPTGDISEDLNSQVSISSNQTFNGYLAQGESLRIDLNPTAGNIDFSWSKTRCASNHKVALLLTLLHLSGAEYQNYYYLIGDNDDNCLYSTQQNFIDAELTAAATYKYYYRLAVPALTNATLYIQTVGAGTDLEVSSGLISNAQYKIESLAKSENEVSYKTIEVNKSLPSAPGFMTFALFSGNNITK